MEIKNKIRFVIPIILLFLTSCYTENKQITSIPDNLFSIDKMTKVMTDVQLTEGALNYKRVVKRENKDYKEAFYNQIFLEYNITANDFKQNLNYYNSQPEIMEMIIEKVIENINQNVGQLEIIIAEERIADSLQRIKIYNDSIRVSDSLINIKIINDSLKRKN